MKRVILHIDNLYGSKTVEVKDEVSLGRTNASQIVLDDAGLSRKNTTFFRDGDDVLVVDENSLNGTFLNGKKISGAPRLLQDRDEITIGSNTRIRVEIREEEFLAKKEETPQSSETKVKAISTKQSSAGLASSSGSPPMILILSVGSIFVILFFGAIALVIANLYETSDSKIKPTPTINTQMVIPVRVIDPLGGEDPHDLDDLIASWETEEKELDASTVQDVKISDADPEAAAEKELEVSAAFLAERKTKALEPRSQPTGISPPGLKVPPELRGDGVIKQKAKLAQMKAIGYKQPMDFADLAEKRLNKELVEMPMATQSFVLEVGGSATTDPFTAFSFQTGDTPILQGSPKHRILSQLATKYGLNLDNPADRKQIRMRLLRMFNQRAKPVLQELAEAYYKKFNRPLRVTSLTRSMDYQISLNRTNPNSFVVRGEGSLPPHTSGCAFDLARKHMDVDEQNFLMEKLAQMERDRKLDALIEYGANACFHIFIYHDGIAPNL
jgi:pSer/pThr/pTyr-binding forkhead associated (FHA) protein